MDENPREDFRVRRKFQESSKGWDAAATFPAQYRLAELAGDPAKVWTDVEVIRPVYRWLEGVARHQIGTCRVTCGR